MSKKAFSLRLEVAESTVSDWEREEIEPKFERLNAMVKLIDESLTMEQCLVLPFEASEAERKYRAILSITGALAPPPIVKREPRPKQEKPQTPARKVSRPANRGFG